MNTTPQDPRTHTTHPSDAVSAWVLADRDSERKAWERAYDLLHPRPAADLDGGA